MNKDRIQVEKNELNTLLDKGAKIEIERRVFEKKHWFGKVSEKREKLQFTIKEPTLAVLDAMSELQIELQIDEEKIKTGDAMSVARRLTHEHSKKMAKLLAIAVLGEEYYIAKRSGGRVLYSFDNRKLGELTALFLNNVKPSQLIQYTMLISTVSNLGDFLNSIRLMSANRTTMPVLVEENKEV